MIYGIRKEPVSGVYATKVFKHWSTAKNHIDTHDIFFCESVFEKELKRRQDGLKVNDTPQQPTYYKSKFDVVDFMDSLPVRMPWLVGDTIKRIIRFEHKEPKKDLEKIKYNIERLKNDKLAQSYFEYFNEFYQRSPVNVDIWLRDFCEAYELYNFKKEMCLNVVFGELDYPTFIKGMEQLQNFIKD